MRDGGVWESLSELFRKVFQPRWVLWRDAARFRDKDVRGFDLDGQREDRLETPVNHIDDFGTSVMHKPSYNWVHLRLEVPIQKTCHVH